MTTSRTISLDQLPPGGQAVVRRLTGGRELAGRLCTLGLVAGASLKMLQNPGRGPLLVSVHDTRIALGRGEAAKVLVEPFA
ncbi:FeoA family protein [Immundisolibacter sp.]|uniref:FeoA family protein n=1 Tax=Immundisolibacter sp. TaxID=1934948 RepID=UPI0026192BD4|nr:FeoA family protein [Immundisolibacter sp.]MDD3650044.1 FeoA family protein [Immundisolibacter sp.]